MAKSVLCVYSRPQCPFYKKKPGQLFITLNRKKSVNYSTYNQINTFIFHPTFCPFKSNYIRIYSTIIHPNHLTKSCNRYTSIIVHTQMNQHHQKQSLIISMQHAPRTVMKTFASVYENRHPTAHTRHKIRDYRSERQSGQVKISFSRY